MSREKYSWNIGIDADQIWDANYNSNFESRVKYLIKIGGYQKSSDTNFPNLVFKHLIFDVSDDYKYHRLLTKPHNGMEITRKIMQFISFGVLHLFLQAATVIG